MAIQAESADLRSIQDDKGRITYRSMIMHMAEKKIIAYTQLSAKRASAAGPRVSKAHGSSSAAVKAVAEGVRSGSSADLLIIERMLADNGILAVVSDNPDYCLTDADVAAGKVLLVCKPPSAGVAAGQSRGSGIGHWVLKGADGKEFSPPSEGVDCGFALVGHLTGKSVDTLRQETADSILKHSAAFEVAVQQQRWLSDRHPELANRLWLRGGRADSESKDHSGSTSSGDCTADSNSALPSPSGVRPTRTEGPVAVGDGAASVPSDCDVLSVAVETGVEALIVAREKLAAAGLGDDEAARQLAPLAGLPVSIALKAFQTLRQYEAQKAAAGRDSMLEAATRVVGSDVVSGLTDRVVSALAGTEVPFVSLLQASEWMPSQGDHLRSQFEAYTAVNGFDSHADDLADAAALTTVLGLPADGFRLLRSTGEDLQKAAARAHQDGFTEHADGLSDAAAIFTLVGSLPRLGELACDAIFGSGRASGGSVSRVDSTSASVLSTAATVDSDASRAAAPSQESGASSSSGPASAAKSPGKPSSPPAGADRARSASSPPSIVAQAPTTDRHGTTTWENRDGSSSTHYPGVNATVTTGGPQGVSVSTPLGSDTSGSVGANICAGGVIFTAKITLTGAAATAAGALVGVAALGYGAYKLYKHLTRDDGGKKDD